jgi:hypothetical protein
MTRYRIKDADGNITNEGINADEEFMAANFSHYEEVVQATIVSSIVGESIIWRDEELHRTDTLQLLNDYPNASALTAYRQELRDFPASPEFPNTRPVMGE